MTPPIKLTGISLARTSIAPFTHILTLVSGPWTHESRLELPSLTLEIHPSKTPGNYVLAAETYDRSYAEPFDLHFGNFTGAISTLTKFLYPVNPVAAHHLLQGVASAMVYFGRQYGYVTLDDEGTVTATPQREDA